MRKVFFYIVFCFTLLNSALAQSFQVDTLLYNGDGDKLINIVILGDGYTATEQTNFIADANNLMNHLFSQVPWQNYKNYFNVMAIKVISAQSGIRHENTASDCNTAPVAVPLSFPNTYLGCKFDAYGIHRLVEPVNTGNVANVLIANFPAYDQVLIIANSPYYGGSGGNYATATTDAASGEITVHELGHSFASLADEYYAGDALAAEKANMTQEFDPTMVKWKNWVGTNGVGVFQHCCGGVSSEWYKPATNCKMEFLGSPYCKVCSEAIVETVHSLVNPILAYLPQTLNINTSAPLLDFKLTEIAKPIPNTLRTQWVLDAQPIAYNTDSVQINQDLLTNGLHTLSVTVTDTTPLARVDNHSSIHVSTVNWTINKTYTGISVQSMQNKFSCTLYPNPATTVLTISIELEKKSDVSFYLMNAKGDVVSAEKKLFNNTSYSEAVNVSGLAAGIYFVVFKVNNTVYTQKFML